MQHRSPHCRSQTRLDLSAQSAVTSSRPLQPVLMAAPLFLASFRIRCGTQLQELTVPVAVDGRGRLGGATAGCRDAVWWEDTSDLAALWCFLPFRFWYSITQLGLFSSQMLCGFWATVVRRQVTFCVHPVKQIIQQAYRNNFVFSSCPSSYSQPMYNKQASINSMQKTSDQEIRGTKEALIQDLEKKLRCKDSLLQNGNQVRAKSSQQGRQAAEVLLLPQGLEPPNWAESRRKCRSSTALYSEPQQIPREQKPFMTEIFFQYERKRNMVRAGAEIWTLFWGSWWTSHPQKIKNPRKMPQFSRHDYNLVFNTIWDVDKHLKTIRTWRKIGIFEISFYGPLPSGVIFFFYMNNNKWKKLHELLS